MLLLNLESVSRWTVLKYLQLRHLLRCEASCQDLVIILPNFSGVVPYLLVYFCVCQHSISLSVSYINCTLTNDYQTLLKLNCICLFTVLWWVDLSCKTCAVEEIKENRRMKNEKTPTFCRWGEQATRLIFMNIMFTFHCGNDRKI
jgi:hypothetical protein